MISDDLDYLQYTDEEFNNLIIDFDLLRDTFTWVDANNIKATIDFFDINGLSQQPISRQIFNILNKTSYFKPGKTETPTDLLEYLKTQDF